MANISQPPVVNYNQVRTLWTEEQCFYLLDQRMYRNDEFWNLRAGGKRRFWRDVANKINRPLLPGDPSPWQPHVFFNCNLMIFDTLIFVDFANCDI
jgi:hypothetical protein